jgi:hypothetical protein
MNCPKCGFTQPEGPECARCGVIFARYRPAAAAPAPGRTPGPAAAPRPAPNPLASAAPAVPGRPVPPVFAPSPAVPPWPAVAAPADPLALVPPPPAPPGTLYDGSASPLFGGAGVIAQAGGGAGGVLDGPVRAPGAVPAPGGSAFFPASSFGAPGEGGASNAGRAAAPVPVVPAFVGRGFELGTILSEVFATYFGNFVPFVLVAGIALLPMFLLSATMTRFRSPQQAVMVLLAVVLAAVIGQQVATGAVTFGVLQEMRRREASIADCLGQALAVLLPILGVALLAGLATAVGFVFCFVPGVILTAMFAVAVPVAVEERPGVVDALRRSAELTTGFRWQVFGVMALLGVLQLGVRFLLGLIPAVVPAAAPLVKLLSGGFQAVGTGISATAAAVMYYRLRSVKEGIDVHEIVSVFD